MRPIFCGNFEYDARQSDLERLFRRYGRVDRVDMKSGFAFVYMEDERDAEDAIRGLDRIEFGRKGRRLRVEWTKQERPSRRPEISRRPSSNLRPSKTLFVINFDHYHTRSKDLERHFDPYGKILNVRIRRNFAFIQFETQEDATKALDATNMTKLLDRVITVEYAVKDDDDRRNGYSPDRSRDRSPRRGYDRVRSPSPRRRERESPDYGHGRGHSPSPYRRERASPDYAHGPSRSPSRKERDSERGRIVSRSPRKERDSDYHRKRSPSPRKERDSDYHHKRSPSPRKERDSDYHHKRSPSPRKERDSDHHHKRSPSPERERSNGENGRGPKPGNASPDYGRGPSPSPQMEEGEKAISPDDYARDRSPAYSDAESPPPERYGSSENPTGNGNLTGPVHHSKPVQNIG
ncbi:serine/arginine-rich splicing factor rs40 [Phtheirospermum japonicum]|uniref:Serine/arginine-rich splicing factor rs40 n=1 Tax=Phtheirospermum japonicum TaxID=374723 RepID=A0A830BLL4_9LAMI|nr:serine/arginine-rich splicing factor rs40 [Phtheirospermum japonicum]